MGINSVLLLVEGEFVELAIMLATKDEKKVLTKNIGNRKLVKLQKDGTKNIKK